MGFNLLQVVELKTLRHLHVVLLELIEGELLVRDGDLVNLNYSFRQTCLLSAMNFLKALRELSVNVAEKAMNCLSCGVLKKMSWISDLILRSSIIWSLSSRTKKRSLLRSKARRSTTKSLRRPGVLTSQL